MRSTVDGGGFAAQVGRFGETPLPLGLRSALPRRREAFSLVEVCIALGIFAFGIVGPLALLPTGLKISKESKSQTVRANILQQISSEIQLTDSSNLDVSTSYFDYEGLPVASSDPDQHFTVTTSLIPSAKVAGSDLQQLTLVSVRIESPGAKYTEFIHVTKLDQ